LFKKLALILVCLGLIIVAAGCNSEDQPEPNTPREPKGSAIIDESQPITQNNSSVEETANNSITNIPGQENDAQAALLKKIGQLAQQGKIINCEFPVETTVIDTVREQWGDADEENYIPEAKGTYVTYTKNNVAFGVNKGSQIFDVRSYDSSLKQVTIAKVKEVLGTPENTHHYDTEDMLAYKVGYKYQLLFLFPKAAQRNSDPVLDHYNVFYPQGTVNSMAEDPGIKY